MNNINLYIALCSLLLSILTLYLAHLRGPKISLIVPRNSYTPIGATNVQPEFQHKLTIKILIANTGIRSGILYNVEVSSKEKVVSFLNLMHSPNSLPTVLQPGEGWNSNIDIVLILSDPNKWKEYVLAHQFVKIKIKYEHNSFFGFYTYGKKTINLDITHLKNYYTKNY